MSKVERREQEEPDCEERKPYLYLILGAAFVVVTGLIIATAGTPAAGFPFVIAAAALLGKGVNDLQHQRRAERGTIPPPANKERELLSAIRDNGGSITPAEAAMNTSLTVKEADRMLSELASGGHLRVESEGGALFYALLGRRSPELEEQ